MNDIDMDLMLHRAREATGAPCCDLWSVGSDQHRGGCTQQPWPAVVRVKAADVAWLIDEVRRLRAQRDSLLLDRDVLAKRAKGAE